MWSRRTVLTMHGRSAPSIPGRRRKIDVAHPAARDELEQDTPPEHARERERGAADENPFSSVAHGKGTVGDASATRPTFDPICLDA